MLYSQIISAKREALWPGHLYYGEVSQLVGTKKKGKGRFTRAIATRVSRGWPMPPVNPQNSLTNLALFSTPGYVIICSPEDNPGADIRPSLEAEGADLGMIDDMSTIKLRGAAGNTSRSRFSMPRDFPRLRERIDELGDVRLVIIDPLMGTATKTVSFNQQVRTGIIEPLQQMASDTGAAFWLVNHFTKGVVESNMADRVAGSGGIGDALRITDVITEDPDNPKVRMFRTLHTNLEDTEAVRFVIMDTPSGIRVIFEEPLPETLDSAGWDQIQRIVVNAMITRGVPVSPQELARLTRLTYEVVHMALAMAERNGLARKANGAWSPTLEAIDSLPELPSGYPPGPPPLPSLITEPVPWYPKAHS